MFDEYELEPFMLKEDDEETLDAGDDDEDTGTDVL